MNTTESSCPPDLLVSCELFDSCCESGAGTPAVGRISRLLYGPAVGRLRASRDDEGGCGGGEERDGDDRGPWNDARQPLRTIAVEDVAGPVPRLGPRLRRSQELELRAAERRRRRVAAREEEIELLHELGARPIAYFPHRRHR